MNARSLYTVFAITAALTAAFLAGETVALTNNIDADKLSTVIDNASHADPDADGEHALAAAARGCSGGQDARLHVYGD
ncbi:hypothetical protein AB4Z48_18670 [Cupriavidus sp. 2TAF22]|uniref:hypothetical protein n=1 Tax=unclassified Cupriavidus TaxID=2640874 RepID=UPI003F8FACF6